MYCILYFWKNSHIIVSDTYHIWYIFVHHKPNKNCNQLSDILIISKPPPKSHQLDKIELATSGFLLCLTSIHFEALMLALFNKLRVLEFGLEGPFWAPGFPASVTSDPGGLWRFDPVALSGSLFSLFSFLEVWTRSLQKVKLQHYYSGILDRDLKPMKVMTKYKTNKSPKEDNGCVVVQCAS